MWSLEHDGDCLSATLRHNRPLPELSFCVQTMYEWFLGSGVWMWEMARYKLPAGDCKLVARSLVKAGPLQFSGNTLLRHLFEAKLLPPNIPGDDLWKPGGGVSSDVADGQNRVYKSDEGTLMRVFDLRPDITMGTLAYGLADATVSYFTKGARIVRWQGSRKVAQTFFSVGMSPEELARFTAEQVSNIEDYNAETTVSKLL